MKIRNLSLMMLALASAGFVACSDDDDIKADKVPSAVRETMTEMFPTATKVQWDRKHPYYVADFYQDNYDKDAWFADDGTWAMTETDYNKSITQLPAAVQTAFQDSEYSKMVIDDVDFYQRVNDAFAAIELDVNGSPDVTVFIAEDGEFINTVTGYNGDVRPDTDIAALK